MLQPEPIDGECDGHENDVHDGLLLMQLDRTNQGRIAVIPFEGFADTIHRLLKCLFLGAVDFTAEGFIVVDVVVVLHGEAPVERKRD